MTNTQPTTTKRKTRRTTLTRTRSRFAGEYKDGSSEAVALAMYQANDDGSDASYQNGDDIDVGRKALLEFLFQNEDRSAHVEFLPNGTAANATIIREFCIDKHCALLGSDVAHVFRMEQQAVNFNQIVVSTDTEGPQAGCLDPHDLSRILDAYKPSIHTPPPTALSISQPNELGIIHDDDRIEQIICCVEEFRNRGHNLYLHVDGSRLHNVLVSDFEFQGTRRLLSMADGVTVGFNKAGGPKCDAVVLFANTPMFNKSWTTNFHAKLKDSGWHDSRGWDNAAGVVALFESGEYLLNARNSNKAATTLGERLEEIGEDIRVDVKYEVHTNAVFVDMPDSILDELENQNWQFSRGLPGAKARFICSWKTKIDDVHALADDIKDIIVSRFTNRRSMAPASNNRK